MGKKTGKRYVNELILNMDPVYINNMIQAYLSRNRFKPVIEKGENCYRRSRGQRFKYSYNDGVLHIEAWVGKVGKELDISDGKIYGAAYKVPYYNSILSLLGAFEKERQIKQYQVAGDYEQQFAQPYGENDQSNYEVLEEINEAKDRNAVLALVLAILSFILAFDSKMKLITNLGSYYFAFTGLKSRKRGIAIVAIIINSIAASIILIKLVSPLLG